MVRYRGSQEYGSRIVNFACKFHRRSHRVRITLKSTTFLFMAVRMCEPRNRDNGASDLWTLTAYRGIHVQQYSIKHFFNNDNNNNNSYDL